MFRSDSGFFDFEHDSDSEPMASEPMSPMSPLSPFSSAPPRPKMRKSGLHSRRPSCGEGMNPARYLLDRSPRKEGLSGRHGAPQCGMASNAAQRCPKSQEGRDGTLSSRFVSRLGRTSSNFSMAIRRNQSCESISAEQASVVFPELPYFPRGLTILIVDENPTTLNANARLLKDYGYEVTWSANGQAALEVLQRAACCFHVILTSPSAADVILSHEVSKSLPLILACSEMGLAAVAKSVMNGCIGFINNPLLPEDCGAVWEWVLEDKLQAVKKTGGGSGDKAVPEVLSRMQHIGAQTHSHGIVC